MCRVTLRLAASNEARLRITILRRVRAGRVANGAWTSSERRRPPHRPRPGPSLPDYEWVRRWHQMGVSEDGRVVPAHAAQ